MMATASGGDGLTSPFHWWVSYLSQPITARHARVVRLLRVTPPADWTGGQDVIKTRHLYTDFVVFMDSRPSWLLLTVNAHDRRTGDVFLSCLVEAVSRYLVPSENMNGGFWFVVIRTGVLGSL